MNARNVTSDYYKDSGRNFYEDVACHLRQPRSVVIWSERLVLMARPVFLDTNPRHIIDPRHVFLDADAWFVHWMSGDLRALASHVDEMMRYKWIAFQRGKRGRKIHIVETEKFIKSCPMIAL